MADAEEFACLREQGIRPMFWTLNELWQYDQLYEALQGEKGDVWIATDRPGASRVLRRSASAA
jgi:hypothetical protein